MARVTVEDCLEKVDNRFSLVLLVSKRSKQILKGSVPTVPVKNNKFVVSALREVAAGKVDFDKSLWTEPGQAQVETALSKS
ncbi:MAG: DNA-directed RNA polymerase subunit omega [Bdellovibrionales bacterium]